MISTLSRSLLVAGVFCVQLPALSATIRVPQQYASIQAAIDAASNGDVIRVAAGTYRENLAIEAKAVSLIGAGASQTILDGGGNVRVIRLTSVPADAVTVAGFTIRNGVADPQSEIVGGGLWASDADVIVRDNVFTGNSACIGMAIVVQGRTAKLLRNRIVDNLQQGCGSEAVLLQVDGESTVDQNVIANNPAAGIYIHSSAKVYVRRNVIRNNAESPEVAARGWGGLGSYVTQLVLEHNLFEHNTGSVVGGVFVGQSESGAVVVRNNSFAGNAGPYASGLMLSPTSLSPDFDVASNLFADDDGTAEIECNGAPRGNANVFASSTTPAFGPGC